VSAYGTQDRAAIEKCLKACATACERSGGVGFLDGLGRREAAGRRKRGRIMLQEKSWGSCLGLGETMTANTSLVRECLELILTLADALDRKQTKPLSTVSRQSLPVTPEVAPVALGSKTVEGVRN
jgi:hypothetical protein